MASLFRGTQAARALVSTKGNDPTVQSHTDSNGFILTSCAYAHAPLFPADLLFGWMATLTARFREEKAHKIHKCAVTCVVSAQPHLKNDLTVGAGACLSVLIA